MYARGLTTRQISEQIEEIYGFECSESFISDLTDNVLQDIQDWQNRALDEIHPILFIDTVHFSVREDNIIRKLVAYVIIGINCDGMKEAISAAFPKTEYQRCIVHQVRNTLKYVSYKEMKEFAADLKKIYLAPDESNLLKSLYLSTLQATGKWMQPIRNWGKA